VSQAVSLYLQIWGGIAYLLAKILLSYAEGLSDDRKLRTAGWAAYLAGLPAWVILLASRQTWIACAVEAGGAPALILGMVVAWKRISHINRGIDWCIKIFTYLMIVLGIFYSIYEFSPPQAPSALPLVSEGRFVQGRFVGITTFTQVLEIGVTFGFLLGTYLLAKKKSAGWLLFAEMLICMCIIMLIQGNFILVVQQAISLVIAIIGFVRSRKRSPMHSIENLELQ
jgi:hypothetical protein